MPKPYQTTCPERRVGELMNGQPKAKPPKFEGPRRVSKRPDDISTLAQHGIDKNLADRARKLSTAAARTK